MNQLAEMTDKKENLIDIRLILLFAGITLLGLGSGFGLSRLQVSGSGKELTQTRKMRLVKPVEKVLKLAKLTAIKVNNLPMRQLGLFKKITRRARELMC